MSTDTPARWADRVRFLERRVDELTRDLAESHRLAAALILHQATAGTWVTLSGRLLDEVPLEPLIERTDDYATCGHRFRVVP